MTALRTALRSNLTSARSALSAALKILKPRSEGWRRVIGSRQLSVAMVTCSLALMFYIWNLRPSSGLAVRIVCCMAVGGSLSVALGVLSLWLADRGPARSLWAWLVTPVALGMVIVSLNVGLLARLLFSSPRDIALALGFLVFGSALAFVVALPITRRLTNRVAQMELFARRIASGEYGLRMEEGGARVARELTQLAHWYNLLGACVLDALNQRQVAEAERRKLVASLSHDLRTPLSSIQLMTGAMADGVITDPATAQRYYSLIEAEVEHLGDLISELFELARLESRDAPLDCELARIEAVADDVLASLQGLADRAGVHLMPQVLGESPHVLMDYDQIRHALYHLAQNALSHTPPGGLILIRVATTPAEGTSAVLAQVVDTGEGISPDDLPHIFEATYRATTSRQRHVAAANQVPLALEAGLGLAIAERIVSAHGGRIWAESPIADDLRAFAIAQATPDGAASAAHPIFAGPGTSVSFTLPVPPHISDASRASAVD